LVDGCVMGIDIASGSPLSRTQRPKYALVVIDPRGKVVYESIEAPLHRVIRVAWEYRVKRIGIDNVFELAPSSRGVAKVLSLLPTDVELYQVTLNKGVFEDIRSLASRIGIELKSKPRPVYTAYIAALLAMKGIGTPVKAVEYRTKIIVSRARSVGSGGSSAQRYARGMRTAVLRVVREIKDSLDRASLNYDLVFKRGRGGLERAVFIVYAPREALSGIVKPFRGNDVVVSIRPEYSRIVLFDEEYRQRKFVVVGIDPGIETGLAVLDLSMRPVLLTSARELDRASIINMVFRVGIPVLVATDKNPAPDAVKKIASTLGVPLYVPPRSLSVSEKEQLIEWLRRRTRCGVKVSTTHERDALAAAVRALRVYERKFSEIERKLGELGIDVDVDEAKLMLIRGRSVDEVVEHAIRQHLEELGYCKREQPSVVIEERREEDSVDRRIRSLESRLEELIREREALREEVKRLRKEVEDLSFELRFSTRAEVDKDTVKDRVVSELRERVKTLSQSLESAKARIAELRNELARAIDVIERLSIGDLEALPKVSRLSLDELSEVEEVAVAKGALFVDREELDLDAIERVRELGIVLLMRSCSDEVKRQLWLKSVAVDCGYDPEYATPRHVLVKRGTISQAIDRARSALRSFLEELERQRRRELSLEKLKKLIEEYRQSLLDEGKTLRRGT